MTGRLGQEPRPMNAPERLRPAFIAAGGGTATVTKGLFIDGAARYAAVPVH